REPLGGDQDREPLDGRPQAPDEDVLGVRVDGREQIVEDEHPWAGDQGARERNTLALATREVDAALADQRVVTIWQVIDEGGDAGGLGRLEDLVPGRLGPAAEQVLAQRDRKQD